MAGKILGLESLVMLNKMHLRKRLKKIMSLYRRKALWPSLVKMTLFNTVFYLALASFSGLLQAQVQPTNQTANTATGNKDVSENNEPKTDNADTNVPTIKAPVLVAPKTATREQKDVFKPSEEISEDFAVPFPVDI